MAPSEQDLTPRPDPADGPRVRTLLASVRDLTASLHRLTAQLERELGTLPGFVPVDGPAEDGTAEPDRLRTELERLRTELDQLRAAQEHRGVIEQAKGMLMADRRCTEQQAFDLLVGMSQAEQRKVRDIAAELVAAAVQGPDRRPPSPATVRPRHIDLDLAGAGLPVGRQPRPR